MIAQLCELSQIVQLSFINIDLHVIKEIQANVTKVFFIVFWYMFIVFKFKKGKFHKNKKNTS